MFFRIDPEFFIFPYLKNHGFIPYSQIIDQHFPGGFFLPINFATLGFTTPEAFQKLLIVIIILISLLIFKITKKFTAVLLFLVLWPFFDGFHLWIDSFTCMFSLMVYYLFSQKKYLLTGIAIAICVLFKQTSILFIPLLIFFQFIIQKNGNKFSFLINITVPTIALLIYFYLIFPKDFWYQTIIFNFTQYAKQPMYISYIPKFLIIFIPGIFVLKKHPLILGFILVNIIGFFARPDLIHLQSIAPFLVLLLFDYIQNISKILQKFFIIFLLLLCLIKYSKITNNDLYFDNNTLDLIEYIKKNTLPGEEIFLLGVQPHVYSFSNTLPTGKYFVYQLPWYMKIYQNKQLDILYSQKPRLIVWDTNAGIDGFPSKSYTEKLVSFTLSYELTHSIGNYLIYEKIKL